jgi:hypothetical protein
MNGKRGQTSVNREKNTTKVVAELTKKKATTVSKPCTSKAIERGNLEKTRHTICFNETKQSARTNTDAKQQNNKLNFMFFITRKWTYSNISKFRLL